MGDESHSQDGMEKRVANLEANVASMMLDVSVMKADVAVLRTDVGILNRTCATKADVSEVKASIIMWLTAVVFVSQLIPEMIGAFRSWF